MKKLFLIILLLILPFSMLNAQEAEETPPENGRLIRYIENKLSNDDMKIRLSGVNGLLASDAHVEEITIADRDGVWLILNDAVINWRYLSFLRGALHIDEIGAKKIHILRRPVASKKAQIEAKPFSLPNLPVAIEINKLDIETIEIDESLFGDPLKITASGAINYSKSNADAKLDIKRIDKREGELTLSAALDRETDDITLDFDFFEPKGGFIANLTKAPDSPPLDLKIAASGTLNDLKGNLTLSADGKPAVTGRLDIRPGTEAQNFDLALEGDLTELIPTAYADFFGIASRIKVKGHKTETGLSLPEITLSSRALNLSGNAEFLADGFPKEMTLTGKIGGGTAPTLLPVSGNTLRVDGVDLAIDFGKSSPEAWNAQFEIENLNSPTQNIGILSLNLNGALENIETPAQRHITARINGLIDGLDFTNAGLKDALSPPITLSGDMSWKANQPVEVNDLKLTNTDSEALLNGMFDKLAFNGNLSLAHTDLAKFSTLANRKLGGAVALKATGKLDLISQGFDLEIDGKSTNLDLAQPQLNRLLEKETKLSGRVERDENGLSFDGLTLTNEEALIGVNGRLSTKKNDLKVNATLEDIAVLDPRTKGKAFAELTIKGPAQTPRLKANLKMPEGQLEKTTLQKLDLRFNGTKTDSLEGTVIGSAQIGAEPIQLFAELRQELGNFGLSNLVAKIGNASLNGYIRQEGLKAFSGNLNLNAQDFKALSALTMIPISGSANLDLSLDYDEGQNLSLNGNIANFAAGPAQIGDALINLKAFDLLKAPSFDGAITGKNLGAPAFSLSNFNATALNNEGTTAFDLSGDINGGGSIALSGQLQEEDSIYSVLLNTASTSYRSLQASLLNPATVVFEPNKITINNGDLAIGSGRLQIDGFVNETLDLDILANNLNLDVADGFVNNLDAEGSLTGNFQVRGTKENPEVSFDLTGNNLATAVTRANNVPAANLTAQGRTTLNTLNIDATLTTNDGVNVGVSGTVPLKGGDMALNGQLVRLPLGLFNRFTKGQNISGEITGTAQVSGPLTQPRLQFDLLGNGIRAAALDRAGIAPLGINARGGFSENTVTLDQTRISDEAGTLINLSGAFPLNGSPMDMALDGALKLETANNFLKERGTSLKGTALFDLDIRGQLSNPQFFGTLQSDGASVVDPKLNLVIGNMILRAALDGRTLRINQLTGELPSNGTASATGQITLDPTQNIPINIDINLDNVRYTVGTYATTRANGSVRLEGLMAGPRTVSGTIDLEKTEIAIPETFGGRAKGLNNLKHRNLTPDLEETIARGNLIERDTGQSIRPKYPTTLDLRIRAPREIYVRGRGLNAELGGEIRLRGPANNRVSTGRFDLIRGRLGILGKNLQIEEGTVELLGDLDPSLRFVARKDSGDTTLYIIISGLLSDLDISFEASPTLPEDEVIARMLFDKPIDELSPLQLASLANAAAVLSGRSTGFEKGLREKTGLDDLNVTTTENGDAAVQAGKYISDKVYTSVEADSSGATRLNLNIDISRNVTARGSVDSEGTSSLGIFFEKDY